MRFVVVGAGAIGGVVGARLHQSGHEVVLLARGAHLEALQTKGLRLRSPEEDVVLDIPAVRRPGDVAWRGDEVVLLATKSHHSAALLDELAAAAPPGIALVSVQNGVDNERQALRRFERVYGICVMLPAQHLDPGVVEPASHPVTGILDIGRFPSGVDDTGRECAEALGESTFESVARSAIMRWKYRKLLTNLANAVVALCPPSEAAGELVRRAESEGDRCLEVAGIDVASKGEDAARRGDRLQIRSVAGRPWGGGSSWQSLARGLGSIEADFLNGEIALLGRLHGIETPVNALLQERAREAALLGLPPGQVSAESLLELVEARGG